MRRVYVDTNVFLSCWFNEFKKKIITSGYYAEQLFEQVVGCKFFMLISDLTVKEILNKMPFSRDRLFSDYLSAFQRAGKLRIVGLDSRIIERAKELSVHAPDNVHLAIVLIEDAILVSNDELLLEGADKVGVRALTPEELLFH